MAMDNFDGIAHVHTLMQKEGTTQEEIKDAYVAWSKTYEQVRVYSTHETKLLSMR